MVHQPNTDELLKMMKSFDTPEEMDTSEEEIQYTAYHQMERFEQDMVNYLTEEVDGFVDDEELAVRAVNECGADAARGERVTAASGFTFFASSASVIEHIRKYYITHLTLTCLITTVFITR